MRLFYRVLCNIPFSLTLTGHCLYDLPSDILEHIFQFFKVQDCLNIEARVCRRFYKIVNDSGALWRSLKTDAEFDVDSFELVIVNHAKHFRDLALQFSQKRVRYNSPAMHIENTLALVAVVVVMVEERKQ